MADQKVHFMTGNNSWGTPPAFMKFLKTERMMTFDLDACASCRNNKAPIFFSEAEDGLRQPWFGDVWLNPPYDGIREWLDKAKREVQLGNCNSVTALIPARTDTKWFHDVVAKYAYLVLLIKGRIKFDCSHYSSGGGGAPFPSMLVIFRPRANWNQSTRCAGITTIDVPAKARGFS